MTVQTALERKALRKIKSGLNRLGRHFGRVPREYIHLNGHDIEIRHRQTRADIEAILQCIMRRQYEVPEIRGNLSGALERYYSKLVADGMKPLIVDAGANIGASALWFATRFPDSHIIAIEPAPDNYGLLCQNVQPFDVDARQLGLGASRGRAALTDPGYGPWAYRTAPVTHDGEITMITLADLVSTLPERCAPFILKLDIEGSEAGVFDGDDNPARMFPIIIMEPHDWMLPAEGSSRSFFRFHVEAGRDFLSRGENVFSIDFALIGTALGLGPPLFDAPGGAG